MPTPNLDLIYERWKAALQDKPKKRENVGSNFDELFDAFNSAGATFEEAHSYLQQAIKVHLPPPGLAKAQWKVLKNTPAHSDKTEKEFTDLWHQDITNRATNSFFYIYPLPEDKDTDNEPKVFGSMSAKEYKLQRRNADSYPILDTEELEKRLQSCVFDPAKDILGEDDNSGESK
jgi:hypothetical protein